MITLGKRGDLHASSKLLLSYVNASENYDEATDRVHFYYSTSKLFSEIAPRYADRQRWITLVSLKTEPRRGDTLAIIELV